MDIQELIGRVAKRHNVLLDAADPIFLAVTLNEVILEEQSQLMQAALERAHSATTSAIGQQLELARKIASHIVTDSGTYVASRVKDAWATVRTDMEAVFRDYVRAAEEAAAAASRQRRLTCWATVASVSCASLAIGAIIARVVR